MAVYVDNARLAYGRMRMAHMLADTIDELMAMADTIELDHRHFQLAAHPHFDVGAGRRRRALAAGAHPADRHALVAAMDRYRVRVAHDPAERARLRAWIAHLHPGREAAVIGALSARAPHAAARLSRRAS